MPYHRSIVNMVPSWGVVAILIVCFVLVAFISYTFVRRFFPKLLTDAMPPSFGVIGTAVGFLMGFTIALLWQNYQSALRLSLDESANFYLMLENAQYLDPASQSKVLSSIDNYLTALKDKEWPSMRLGLKTSDGWNAFNQINETMHSITPTGSETAAYNNIMRLLDSVTTNRLQRFQTVDPLLSIELFPVIILGAFFIIFSVAAHSPKNTYSHILSIFVVCVLIAINIGLAVLITYPFSGGYAVKGTALLEGIPRKLKEIERENNKKLYAKKFQVQPVVAATPVEAPKPVEAKHTEGKKPTDEANKSKGKK